MPWNDDYRFDDDFLAAYDYKVEAYGDPCPKHNTLRWGGDCPDCQIEEMNADNDAEIGAALLARQEEARIERERYEADKAARIARMRAQAAEIAASFTDDDIPF